jgi:hypothetical protein
MKERTWLDWLLSVLAILAVIVQIASALFQLSTAISVVALVTTIMILMYFVMQSEIRRTVESIRTEVEREETITAPAILPGVTSERAHVLNSTLYGMAYEELSAHCTVHQDGSAVFRREIDLVAYSIIGEVDHYMLLPEAPKESKDLLELANAKSLVPDRKLTPEIIQLSSGRLSLLVYISPPMSPGDHIRYQVIEKSPPGLYAITGLEERKVPYDYFGWDISRPTRKLAVKVFFPEGISPKAFEYDVWYAVSQSRSRQAKEYERIRGALQWVDEGARFSLALDVLYPVLGLTYVIKWTPRPAPRETESPSLANGSKNSVEWGPGRDETSIVDERED